MQNSEGSGNAKGAGWKHFGASTSRRSWRLEPGRLCAEARRRSGLEDFGDPPLEPALTILTESLEHEARLHSLGRFLMWVHLRDILVMRLRLANAWKDAPGAQPPIRRPVFIIGMPRSGSTFLHELLAEDPENRSPRVWEVMFPLPAPDGRPGRREKRVWKTAMCLWWFRRLAPEADAVYPMRAQTPHECVAIQSYTLLSQEFISTCRIPAYDAFLRSTDLRPSYEWEKRFLQHLQSRQAEKRWVLKSPDHVHGLKELFAVFPDAMIIQTHRNPLEVLRSSSHLTRVLQGLYAEPSSRDLIGEREARLLAEGTERFIRFRDQHPELKERFIDLRYTDLVADPIATVKRVYQWLNLPLSLPAEQRMRALISMRARYPNRHTLPTLADLGLSVPTEARRFQDYCSRFGVLAGNPN